MCFHLFSPISHAFRQLFGWLSRMPHLVTASVDRIRLQPGVAISLDKNYAMSGQVSWVGSSSLVIHMKLTRADDLVDVLQVRGRWKGRERRAIWWFWHVLGHNT